MLGIGAGVEEQWTLPASSNMQTYDSLKSVPCQDDGVYWVPLAPNEKAIDSLRQPSMLFQMTVAAGHEINATGLHNAAKRLVLPDPELIFVVPADVYPRCLPCSILISCADTHLVIPYSPGLRYDAS